MYGNNGLRARSDRGFNEVGINAIRLAQDVHHDGHGARKQNCARGRDESRVGNNNFVAGTDFQRGHYDL